MSGRLPPRLQTQRLLLRDLRDGDLDAYAAMVADPEVMRHLGAGQPVDRASAWRQLAMFAGHWLLRGYGLWALERRSDAAFLGRAGLWQPEGWPGLEVGWALTREAWGHGYATEAARAVMRWAWDELDAERLISVIAPDNEPSIRVALRLGMRHAGDEEIHGRVCHIYALDRPAA